MKWTARSIASLPTERRRRVLAGLSPREKRWLLYHWPFWARPEQLEPPGDWSTWLVCAGRGYGKSRTGAEWVRDRAERSGNARIALVAPTAADARDVIVEGESGILAVSPPWFRPIYEPSKRRLTWPNGAVAMTYSAEEPDRLRGPQHSDAYLDEVAAYRHVATYDNLKFGLRLGANPKTLITTTPRPTKLFKRLLADPGTVKTGGSTYDNRANLAPTFFDSVVARYEGTPLGEQEIHAQLREVTEGAWFPAFSVARHVTEGAEYRPGVPVLVAVDCGTSRYTGAVLFQVSEDGPHRHRVNVFADYLSLDTYSRANAEAIHGLALSACGGHVAAYLLDPAANQRTGVGPAVYGEYEQALGRRLVRKWPSRPVTDGLDMIEVMLGLPGGKEPELAIHPRCVNLIDAFKNYRRREHNGEFLDVPVDPDHPHEDLMDALRGGLCDAFPDGRKPKPIYIHTPARNVFR